LLQVLGKGIFKLRRYHLVMLEMSLERCNMIRCQPCGRACLL